MRKKIFLAFGLGAVVGTVVTYLIKEKELEELREIFDDEEDFDCCEYEEDFFDELDEEFDADYAYNGSKEETSKAVGNEKD